VQCQADNDTWLREPNRAGRLQKGHRPSERRAPRLEKPRFRARSGWSDRLVTGVRTILRRRAPTLSPERCRPAKPDSTAPHQAHTRDQPSSYGIRQEVEFWHLSLTEPDNFCEFGIRDLGLPRFNCQIGSSDHRAARPISFASQPVTVCALLVPSKLYELTELGLLVWLRASRSGCIRNRPVIVTGVMICGFPFTKIRRCRPRPIASRNKPEDGDRARCGLAPMSMLSGRPTLHRAET
jgi:hypothetical protein